jgi:hypothetical protein
MSEPTATITKIEQSKLASILTAPMAYTQHDILAI